MRKFLFLLLVPAIFACEEKDLTQDNPPNEKKNINIQTSFILDTSGIRVDSIYTNNVGLEFFFTEVKVTFSNYVFTEQRDTIVHFPEPFMVSLERPERLIGELPIGGYSGTYGLQLGMDSTQSFGFTSSSAQDEVLKESTAFRDDNYGIDHVIIKGRVFDPTDPLDSVGKIPFEYRIGTYLLNQNRNSAIQNFSVSSSSQIPFILQVDLWPMFAERDIVQVPMVASDPDNLFDMAEAQTLADSLRINLF